MQLDRENAAIVYEGRNYSTNLPELMGRHSASEGFLQAFVRNADVKRLYCHTRAQAEYLDFQRRIEEFAGKPRETAWIPFVNGGALKDVGCLYRPGPDIGFFAWHRRRSDTRAYSICGVTHATAGHDVADVLANPLVAP